MQIKVSRRCLLGVEVRSAQRVDVFRSAPSCGHWTKVSAGRSWPVQQLRQLRGNAPGLVLGDQLVDRAALRLVVVEEIAEHLAIDVAAH
jgi:hypothetical protein